MTGWLIINHYLHGDNYNRIHQWIIDAANKFHIKLEVKTNAELLCCIGFSYTSLAKPDFVLFWDKDVRLAEFLENLQIPVYNSAESIRICDDKSLTHLKLSKAGFKMPKTILAPMTFANIGYTDYDFLKEVMDKLCFPIVVKEAFGSFGQQVYLANNEEQLCNIVKKIGTRSMLFQEFITCSRGQDIRLQVVGDRVIAGMNRFSVNGDFRANLTNGGSMRAYSPTVEEEELAISCCRELGLTFAGVDLLFSEEGQKYICEVNSNAHFRGIYECCQVNAAEEILRYITESLKKHNWI